MSGNRFEKEVGEQGRYPYAKKIKKQKKNKKKTMKIKSLNRGGYEG